MAQAWHIKFQNIDGVVKCADCDDLMAALQQIFLKWPFERSRSNPDIECVAEISLRDSKYSLWSIWNEDRRRFPDPIDAVCGLVAALAVGLTENSARLLNLHAAAVEFKDHVILMPATRRAGKSSLTVAMAARGGQVLSDDFLPMDVNSCGTVLIRASGVAPRLRLPIPAEWKAPLRRFVTDLAGLESGQYRYLINDQTLAEHGRSAVPTVVVMPCRDGTSPPQLRPASSSEALKAMIHQNFGRGPTAGRTLAMLHRLVSSIPCFHLHYRAADDAAEYLAAEGAVQLNSTNTTEADANLAARAAKQQRVQAKSQRACTVAKDVIEYDLDGERFVANPVSEQIILLNPTSNSVWQLLAEGCDGVEIVELMCSAFPQVEFRQIQSDVGKIIAEFTDAGLLEVPAQTGIAE